MITINILKIRYFSYFVSILMISAFIFGLIYKKYYTAQKSPFMYSVEFAGGYQVSCEINTKDNVDITAEGLKHSLEVRHYKGVSIRSFGANRFLLRFPASQELMHDGINFFTDYLKSVFLELFPEATCVIEDCVYIGSGVGEGLWQKGLVAVLVALAMMFLYMWIRFPSWYFSFANLISLLHDVLGILLFLMWGDIEISLDVLIAILFIIGYSINDTIVIFSMIRKQIELHKKNNFVYDVIINKSISLTLRRTLLTSFFTSLVVVPLWLFGGYALQALAVPILLGIVFGTYSSIAIASTVLHDMFVICK